VTSDSRTIATEEPPYSRKSRLYNATVRLWDIFVLKEIFLK